MPAKWTEYIQDEEVEAAIEAAIRVGRPLLVRGEPGIGKSTLARVYAARHDRFFISEVVTARTEPNDMLWQFDAVARLAEAQMACRPGNETKEVDLNHRAFLAPGVLWWAFKPHDAYEQYSKCKSSCYPSYNGAIVSEKIRKDEKKGWVVLIDEIDKADSDVPNSLLEAFADRQFKVPYIDTPVCARKVDDAKDNPLIVITTNDERELPAAFLRRCFVVHMKFPEGEEAQQAWLVKKAEVHEFDLEPDELEQIASIVVKDRTLTRGRHKPGLSEFLDFAASFVELKNHAAYKSKSSEDLLAIISQFSLRKNII